MILNIRFDYLELNVISSPCISKGYIKIVLLEFCQPPEKAYFIPSTFVFAFSG